MLVQAEKDCGERGVYDMGRLRLRELQSHTLVLDSARGSDRFDPSGFDERPNSGQHIGRNPARCLGAGIGSTPSN
jgi:hypothetical protein